MLTLKNLVWNLVGLTIFLLVLCADYRLVSVMRQGVQADLPYVADLLHLLRVGVDRLLVTVARVFGHCFARFGVGVLEVGFFKVDALSDRIAVCALRGGVVFENLLQNLRLLDPAHANFFQAQRVLGIAHWAQLRGPTGWLPFLGGSVRLVNRPRQIRVGKATRHLTFAENLSCVWYLRLYMSRFQSTNLDLVV